jgi:hypothetical protein
MYATNQEILGGIDQAFQDGVQPRLQPNGFVQLDLPDNRRLHVWPDESVPQPDPSLPIHDHTFSFTSMILAGSLRNIVYEIEPHKNGLYHTYEIYPFLAGRGHNPFQQPDRRLFELVSREVTCYQPGDSYQFPAGKLHETETEGLTATVIHYYDLKPERFARVLCPRDATPDNIFRRDCLPQDKLWEFIGKLVDTLKD